VQLTATHVRTAIDIERAIESLARKPGAGVIILPSLLIRDECEQIIALTNKHRVPAICSFRPFVTSGLLVSYSADWLDLYRRAASYVDRILKGEKPSDLPVQQPRKYELIINLKTARAIGVEVPPSLLARADEVIE
jgi:putative ABC transport system substrate-binding protein